MSDVDEDEAQSEDKKKPKYPPRRPLPERVVQQFTHYGQLYSVYDLCEAMDAGVKPKDAVRKLYPSTPKESIGSIVKKLKLHPYYLARKDIQLSILKEKGADLQMNLLDLAFNARSEMVRYSATSDSLNRVYGEKNQDDGDDTPKFVFNFNMGDKVMSVDTSQVQANTVIDVEATDAS